jgi:MYXO-CTERM domain-containing protein
MRSKILLSIVLLAALGGRAHAQSFPADNAYHPLRCGNHVATDGRADVAGFLDEADLVGDLDHSAAYRAADGQFLYVRIRLDADAIPNGTIQPFSWGLLIDKNDSDNTYDVLALVDGVSSSPSVLLYKNTTTGVAFDATDPADTPAFASYPLSSHAASTVAADTNYGNNGDFFLSFAIPWSDLRSLGIETKTPVRAWVASSDMNDRLDGDFVCFSGSGTPLLSDLDVADQTALDPVVDSDGDGYSDASEIENGTNPDDANDHPSGSVGGTLELAGGGGCQVGGGGGSGGMLLVLGALLLVRRRRVRAASRP